MFMISARERKKVIVMARFPFIPAYAFFQRAGESLAAIFAEVRVVTCHHQT
jgi:hypothetical protein